MTKKYHLELALVDEGTFVKAVMRNKQRFVLDYENEDSRQVRVRTETPDKDLIITNSKYWVECGDYESVGESIESYISSMQKAIFEQIQEIRKAMKRINNLMQCIKIARDALKEHQSDPQ